MKSIELKAITALEKVFPTEIPYESPYMNKESVCLNELYRFQVAYRGGEGNVVRGKKYYTVKVAHSEDIQVKLYHVGLVPSAFPCYSEVDTHYLKVEPGLFPDVLQPIESGSQIEVLREYWESIWVEVLPVHKYEKNQYDITLCFVPVEGEEAKCTVSFEVIQVELPPQKLIYTQWFHADCIKTYHNVETWSKEHWNLIRKYLKMAVDNGVNMILTPVLTPALDTDIGGERPTTQLVDITYEKGIYQFDFTRLTQWIELCEEVGIQYFECSHFFTQWGARYTPKIIVKENGEEKKKFGWHTTADSEAYKVFLDDFLPELINYICEKDQKDKWYFHISDEPTIDHLESYNTAKQLVKHHLQGFPIIDALSDYDFYEKGIVEKPIPANDHIKPFLENKVQGLWTYYCCVQNLKVSNRFFAMPSYRNRILGAQLFKYGIEGFLHWGYNFYYTQFSKKAIDPYSISDAGRAFPSGDAFSVYPVKDGCIPSLRLHVTAMALDDLRAMQLLEMLSSKEDVVSLLEEILEKEVAFDCMPDCADRITAYRKKINQAIEEIIKGDGVIKGNH